MFPRISLVECWGFPVLYRGVHFFSWHPLGEQTAPVLNHGVARSIT